MLYDQAERGKSNMAASKPEVPISRASRKDWNEISTAALTISGTSYLMKLIAFVRPNLKRIIQDGGVQTSNTYISTSR